MAFARYALREDLDEGVGGNIWVGGYASDNLKATESRRRGLLLGITTGRQVKELTTILSRRVGLIFLCPRTLLRAKYFEAEARTLKGLAAMTVVN